MSSEPPPTYNTPVFNQAYWGIQPELGPLDNRYLQFPTGQGTETIPSLVVTNQATIASVNIKLSGLIRGIKFGTVSGGASGTHNFGFTFASIPIVVGTITTNSTLQVFSLTIHDITTTGFSFKKNYITTSGTGGGGAGESFIFIAICS